MKNIIYLISIFFISQSFASNEPIAKEISKHYEALPANYILDKIEKEEIAHLISRQYVMGAGSMMVKWTLKKGAHIPLQIHRSEQITWITQGSVRVLSQGKEYIIKSGGVMIIPAFVPHEFFALEDTIDIDFFAPAREDWLKDVSEILKPTSNETDKQKMGISEKQNEP